MEYDLERIKEFLSRLEAENKISKAEREAIRPEVIYKFTETELAKRLKTAEIIEKEKPFYTRVSVRDAYGIESDEMILVQGIMDLYFIDKDSKLVLVDYKTDFVKDGNELVERYEVQLKMYKSALEEALKREVDEVYIYSTCLGREILVEGD